VLKVDGNADTDTGQVLYLYVYARGADTQACASGAGVTWRRYISAV